MEIQCTYCSVHALNVHIPLVFSTFGVGQPSPQIPEHSLTHEETVPTIRRSLSSLPPVPCGQEAASSGGFAAFV